MPSFGSSAGARLIVMCRAGYSRSELVIALLTRSFASSNGLITESDYLQRGETLDGVTFHIDNITH